MLLAKLKELKSLNNIMRIILFLLFLMHTGGAFALEQSSSTPVGVAVPSASVNILQWLLSCILVIFLMFFLAYLLKRAKFVPGLRGSLVKIVSVVVVGAHERIALVKVAEQYFLVGITAQQITKLAEIDPSQIPAEFKESSQSKSINSNDSFANKLFAFMTNNMKDQKDQPKPKEEEHHEKN